MHMRTICAHLAESSLFVSESSGSITWSSIHDIATCSRDDISFAVNSQFLSIQFSACHSSNQWSFLTILSSFAWSFSSVFPVAVNILNNFVLDWSGGSSTFAFLRVHTKMYLVCHLRWIFNVNFFGDVSTMVPYSAYFEPFLYCLHSQTPISESTSQNFLSQCWLTLAWPFLISSRGTTRSSILFHLFDFCRRNPDPYLWTLFIQQFFSRLEDSVIFTWMYAETGPHVSSSIPGSVETVSRNLAPYHLWSWSTLLCE